MPNPAPIGPGRFVKLATRRPIEPVARLPGRRRSTTLRHGDWIEGGSPAVNVYSTAWFETFLRASAPPPVDRELAFFERHAPLPEYRRVLDVACGIGRHARALAEVGYDVVGIDNSEDVLAVARAGAPSGAAFALADMRGLSAIRPGDAERFDAVICLWQSFGNFPEPVNRDVLAGMAGRLRPGGRLLLDVYNRDALPALPSREVETRDGRTFRTTRSLEGGRFAVRIAYEGSDDEDRLEWQVFTPDEIVALGEPVGLSPILTCAWFDDRVPAGPEHVRMQVLFETAGSGGATPSTRES